MKNYAVLLTNIDTGEIEHCATHTEPIPVENYPVIDSGNYEISLYEFDSIDEAVPFVRAREVLDRVTREGVNPIDKMSSVVELKNPVIDTLIDKFTLVTEFNEVKL